MIHMVLLVLFHIKKNLEYILSCHGNCNLFSHFPTFCRNISSLFCTEFTSTLVTTLNPFRHLETMLNLVSNRSKSKQEVKALPSFVDFSAAENARSLLSISNISFSRPSFLVTSFSTAYNDKDTFTIIKTKHGTMGWWWIEQIWPMQAK